MRGHGVGGNNIDKLKEIVTTGAFRRNELLAKDLHHQTIKLVSFLDATLLPFLHSGMALPAFH